MRSLDSVEVFLCGGWSSPVLLSECWNGDFKSEPHHPPWNPPFFFFIGYRGSPPPFPRPLLLPSFSLLSFFPPRLSLPGFFPPQSQTISIFSISLSSGLSLNYPGTLQSLHLCPSLRQWHMDCVNSWAAGQPQIRYEYTAHEAQLFKRLSPILHTHIFTQLL